MGLEYTPPVDGIYVIKVPSNMRYRFEYHPGVKRVFVIDLAQKVDKGKNAQAEIAATDVADHGAAVRAVLEWNRGYKAGLKDAHDQPVQLIGG